MEKPQNALGKKKQLRLMTFLIAFFVATAFFIPFLITGHGYFIFFGDFNVQQIPFYRYCHDAVRNGQFGWSYVTDLGSNFIGSYAFYLLGSPFFWLTIPFPGSVVPYLMAPLLILKFSFAALTAYLYIRRFTARAETARQLQAAATEHKERLAETKALAEKRLSDVREETTSRIEAAKAGNAERIEAAKQRVNERIAEVRTEVDARIAFDNRLTRLSTRLEELKHRRQSLRPAKKLHAFYRRGLLRGNPTAVSSKFAAALKELKEQNSTKIGPFA